MLEDIDFDEGLVIYTINRTDVERWAIRKVESLLGCGAYERSSPSRFEA